MASTRKVITPKFRASYCNLLEPKESEGGAWYYGLTMIFDPDEINADPQETALFRDMQKIVEEAIAVKWPDGAPKTGVIKPFRKGVWKTPENERGFDLDKNPEYEGKIIVATNGYTEKMPDGSFNRLKEIGIVGPDGKAPLNISALGIYSGMYGRAEISAYVPKNLKKGPMVTFGLHNFQKVEDGAPLGGGTNGNPENAFAAFVQPEAAGNHEDLLGI